MTLFLESDATDQEKAWAIALCEAGAVNPHEMVGEPKKPRWVSWLGYAKLAIIAAQKVAA